MGVDGGKKERVSREPEQAPEIALEHAVKKKAKEKFLGDGRNGDRKNDDHDPLIDRLRRIEKFHDALFARAASEKALGNCVGQRDQRISRQHQDCSGAESTKKTEFGKTAQEIQIKSTEPQKGDDNQNNSEGEEKILHQVASVKLNRWMGK